MRYDPPLIAGTLIRRYKRFLADIRLPSGEVVTAHTANSGSMKGCSTPGSPVRLAPADKPGRKLRYDWEQILVGETWVGVRPSLANDLAEEAIRAGVIPELGGYGELRREVAYGSRGSRVDLVLSHPEAGRRAFVEVKSVSLAEGDVGLFPDAVSTRATKHMKELMEVVAGGDRGVLLYAVQRGDVRCVRPADAIDPTYGAALREAAAAGVELLAYRVRLSEEAIALRDPLPVELPPA